MDNNSCVLALNKLVFDKIEFRRKGFKNKKSFEAKFEATVSNYKESEYSVVTLVLNGRKEDEYELEIELSGYFSFSGEVDDKLKEILLEQNAVAILMPYMRSEVSLITAQPETECVVLPPMNVSQTD